MLYCNRNLNLQTSKASLKSQAQGTSLFTSAASNQTGCQRVKGLSMSCELSSVQSTASLIDRSRRNVSSDTFLRAQHRESTFVTETTGENRRRHKEIPVSISGLLPRRKRGWMEGMMERHRRPAGDYWNVLRDYPRSRPLDGSNKVYPLRRL